MLYNYDFRKDDEVITVTGERGKIRYICDCERCKKRGFNEPVWMKDGDVYPEYITEYMAKNGFKDFYQIGEYRFYDFNRTPILLEIAEYERKISELNKRLEFIDSIEKAVEED